MRLRIRKSGDRYYCTDEDDPGYFTSNESQISNAIGEGDSQQEALGDAIFNLMAGADEDSVLSLYARAMLATC